MSDTPNTPDPPPGDPPTPGKGRPNPGAAAVAAAALAAGQTAKEAAATASVHERTVRKWLRKPLFAARVRELRDEAVGAALNRLSATMTAAADVLRGLLDHECPHVKFKAARAVIELGLRLKEAAELEQRVRDLEARLAQVSQ